MHNHPIVQLLYSSTFTLLFVCLLCLLLITPGDIIRQALSNDQTYNVFVIAGVYLLTLVSAIILYASRLYTNRVVLAGIPKGWIPIEEGEVSKRVRSMVAAGLARSLAIADAARPRGAVGGEAGTGAGDAGARPDEHSRAGLHRAASMTGFDRVRASKMMKWKMRRRKRSAGQQAEAAHPILSKALDWSHIAHRGWSAPSSAATAEFPHLHYRTVVCELGNLVEAKAVSLAPAEPTTATTPTSSAAANLDPTTIAPAPAPPHPLAVALLQRPLGMSLRDYIAYLASLGVVNAPQSSCAEFIARYEHARFSDEGLTGVEFRALMSSFTELLHGMTELDGATLAHAGARGAEGGDDDDDDGGGGGHDEGDENPASSVLAGAGLDRAPPSSASENPSTSTASLADQGSSRASSSRTIRTARSFVPSRVSGRSTPWMTAPATPRVRRRGDGGGGGDGGDGAGAASGVMAASSAASSRSSLSTRTSSSSRLVSAAGSTSSVIRLAVPGESQLPFVYTAGTGDGGDGEGGGGGAVT